MATIIAGQTLPCWGSCDGGRMAMKRKWQEFSFVPNWPKILPEKSDMKKIIS